jgi:hypothetical protein
MFNMSHKFEISALPGAVAPGDLVGLGTFAMKYGIQAIVTGPDYIEALFADRLRLGCVGRYKIICAVDFDRGRNFALSKFRALPTNALAADGFDVLLSANRPDKESYNELKAITQFIREMMDPLKEIRWTLDLRSRSQEDVKSIMPYLVKFPATYIRTAGAYLSDDAGDVSVETHLKDIEFIRQFVGTPIKIGGGDLNFMTVTTLAGKAAAFDATAGQIRRISRAAEEADQKRYAVGVDMATKPDQSVKVVVEAPAVEAVVENPEGKTP